MPALNSLDVIEKCSRSDRMNWNNYYMELLRFGVIKEFDLDIGTGENAAYRILKIYEV